MALEQKIKVRRGQSAAARKADEKGPERRLSWEPGAGSVAAKGLQNSEAGVERTDEMQVEKGPSELLHPHSWSACGLHLLAGFPTYLPSDVGSERPCDPRGYHEHFQVRAKVQVGMELFTLPTGRTMLVTVMGGV